MNREVPLPKVWFVPIVRWKYFQPLLTRSVLDAVGVMFKIAPRSKMGAEICTSPDRLALITPSASLRTISSAARASPFTPSAPTYVFKSIWHSGNFSLKSWTASCAATCEGWGCEDIGRSNRPRNATTGLLRHGSSFSLAALIFVQDATTTHETTSKRKLVNLELSLFDGRLKYLLNTVTW